MNNFISMFRLSSETIYVFEHCNIVWRGGVRYQAGEEYKGEEGDHDEDDAA
jgi:hypothetical protein